LRRASTSTRLRTRSTSGFVDTVEARLNAAIVGTGNVVTVLAGENLARSIAGDLLNVRDSLAVLAVGDVIAERRSNSATTTALDIGFDINAIVAFSTIGHTADGLTSSATRMVTLLLGEALRTTSVWEVTAHPVALAIGWLADTVGRVCAGRRCVAMITVKVAGTADATEGASMIRVVTLLFALLIVDKSGEVFTRAIPAHPIHDLLRHWVAVKEVRKDG